jgi:citrate lyase beta subunit
MTVQSCSGRPAAESGPGPVQVDGRMVDQPVIARALRILARA